MTDENTELLRKIAKDVAELKAALANACATMAFALGAPVGGGATSRSGGGVGGAAAATPAELDSQYGDPEVRSDPKRWEGESFVGRRFSETTPDYLECLAEFKNWQAGKDEEAGAKDKKGRPKAQWARKDAKLALGWAARLRSGWKPKSGGATAGGARGQEPSDEDYGGGFGGGSDDDIPF